MTVETLTVVLLGAGFGAGVCLVIAGWRGWSLRDRLRRDPSTAGRVRVSRSMRWRLGAGAAAALVVGLVTRWPVAAVGAAGVVVAWPMLFGGAAEARRHLSYLDGLATWTEALRDTISGAIGLEQAIPATVDNAPQVLALPLDHLNARLKVRTPLPEALHAFAEDLNDPGADLVVTSLIVNSRTRGPGLRDTLTTLATATRAELEQEHEIEAERRSLRRDARIIIGVTLAFAALVAVGARDMLAYYDSPTGQFALAVVVGIFVGGFAWIRSASRIPRPPRFLAELERVDTALRGGAWR